MPQALRYGSQIVGEETAGNVTIYIYDTNGSPIGMQYRGANYAENTWDVFWYEKNLQGDIVAVYSASGTKLISYTYDAWGNHTKTYHNGGANTVSKNNPFRYRGYYYDADFGLYYLNSRYYDSAICRFISLDEIGVIAASPNALTDKNLYSCCDNNPVMRADNGGALWHILAGAAIGGIIGAISSIATQAISGQEINWAEVGVSAASGAITGAITSACPGMGAVATGIVNGVVGAGTYAATELVNGRTPTAKGVLTAGIVSGVLAGASKAIDNAISNGRLEIGKIKGGRASAGYPGIRYKTKSGPAYSIELHGSHNGHTPHIQVNKWLYHFKGYEGQPYRFKSWHYEIFKPWKGVY